ncbi:hypothetical protein COW81_00330 [Candidatus Campbellbacteria bacterium CG22_combo_CG10-13_8_21_14_all_36_13]|uniref:Helicase HerA central domain-containing protein n=1 Tax=Candidatus Campbellbacteria bacterium CG22_combo_CG10-13_8_21_14_all_36_13 TaxID=1974529 RepID=A0A2H0DZK8_9BACT|nr:MAG: hypothetical protein COW81_00330 [Candidatus Campbellbacteria bacterium CG22_combo_CG10-13_8_21_14_all_36_13]
MMNEGEKVTYFAETDHRNKKIKFGIKSKDRTKHVYVIGKTGMGKSTLLENMAVQDIQNGNGFAFIDPHGKSAELFLDYIPEHRKKDVLYFAPYDLEYPISFNVMEDVGADRRHLVASGLMSAFKKIWVDAWSARMEYILNNALLALLEYPDSTLLGVNRMLADKTYRKRVVANITDVSVKAFWQDEFEKYGERYMQEAGAAIQNKVGQFISNPLVRNIIGQPRSTFDIREMMDNKKILIIDLSKGKVGEDNANLIGSMLITKIYLAAMSRADLTQEELGNLPNFYLYVDEFQSFANESFADILSEARKYKLNLTIAHQYVEQMSDEVRAAVFGNVGTMIAFRVGAYDAEVFEKEFAPEFTMEDLVNLGMYQIYLKLMIDGVASRPFSASTLGPIKTLETSLKKEIIDSSRATFGNTKEEVIDVILRWHESPAGLLDDPQVDAMRRKRKEEEEARKNGSFQKNNNNVPVAPNVDKINNNLGGGNGSKQGGNNYQEDNTGNKNNQQNNQNNQNNRPQNNSQQKNFQNKSNDKEKQLRDVISFRKSEQDKEDKNTKKKQNIGQTSQLRDALAKVLSESQRGVEEKVKKMEAEVEKVKAQNKVEEVKPAPEPAPKQDVTSNVSGKVENTNKIISTEQVTQSRLVHEIPKTELEKMLDAGEPPKKS